jgi:ATP-binding cassette, subfamily B, bacterial HlyB/CyaB
VGEILQPYSSGVEPKNLASLAWFTKSTLKYTLAIAELMVIAIALRLAGLVQPFVFQAIIDRVLPFQREATLVLIVGVLVGTALFTAVLGAISAYLQNHMANALTMELGARIFGHVLHLPLRITQRLDTSKYPFDQNSHAMISMAYGHKNLESEGI